MQLETYYFINPYMRTKFLNAIKKTDLKVDIQKEKNKYGWYLLQIKAHHLTHKKLQDIQKQINK